MVRDRRLTQKKSVDFVPWMQRQEGDHVVYTGALGVPYWLHHGVYVGNDSIVHFWGSGFSDKDSAIVMKSTVLEFEKLAKGKPIYVVNHMQRLPRNETVRRALSRIGQKNYDILCNNCEHFAYWCVTGNHESPQVQDALRWFT